ncbi:hypothetical protein KA012_01645 [Candidatus Woesebacteria bacterium]|nr:hypothetical protein [Candidatus Woesebacteria bacterium]
MSNEADEANTLEPQTLEAVLNTEFASQLSKSIIALVSSGAIRPQKEYPGFVLDRGKAQSVLGKLVKQRGAETITDHTATTELSLQETKDAFLQSLRSILRVGLMPGELMGQVARIIKPSNISVTDSAFARFVYFSSTFPKKNEGERGDLEVGAKVLGIFIDRIAAAAEQTDLKLTQAQQKQLALRLITTHEYGHAVHQAKILQRIEAALVDQPDELISVVNEQTQAFDHTITYDVAANAELAGLFEGEEVTPFSSNNIAVALSERIATGFQDVGVVEALLEMGFVEEQAKQFLAAYHSGEATLLRETKLALQTAKNAGFSTVSLSSAIDDVAMEMRTAGKNEEYDLVRYGFGATNFGYYFPLSRKELEQMISL